MKKFFLGLFLAASLALPSKAAQYSVQSFFNPQISALVVSNALMGATNLNYIAQNVLQGLYLVGTNSLGSSINAPIATNFCPMFYSNSVPTTWYQQPFQGSLVALTNAAFATTLNTNNVLVQLVATNNNINFFQDVSLPQDFWTGVTPEASKPITGASTNGTYAATTNAVAMLQIVSSPFSLFTYGPGAGSNQVTLGFSPIFAPVPGTSSFNAIPGFYPNLEPTDAAVAGGVANTVWTITYTNQISRVGAPTVVNYPVPRWAFPCKGMRLRWIYTDVATNAICINSVTLSTYTP